jgi:hypothetical protein
LPEIVADEVALGDHGELGHRRPAGATRDDRGIDVVQFGEAGQLAFVESKVVLEQPFDSAVGSEPGERQRRCHAAGEDEMPVRRHQVEHVGEQAQPLGAGRHVMHVVEDQGHRRRRSRPHQIGDRPRRPCVARRTAADRPGEVTAENLGVAVVGIKAEPHVVTSGRQAVLGDRLGEQRRLPETRPADHQRQPPIPPFGERTEQAGSSQPAGPQHRCAKPERTWHGPRVYRGRAARCYATVNATAPRSR